FGWQANASGQSGYNETITSTFFYSQHSSAQNPNLEYHGDSDQAQGTAFQRFAREVGGAADESLVGEFHLFNPSSTTYVKHFYSRTEHHNESAYAMDSFAAGYINITAAITNVQFKMESGNFDGKIKMWGVK
ncbi:MAG: hypothetical protein QF535_00470, partial [Anaerolineales bacterium]|nr:hypothetical protein [Anaerolineales bacterium]